MDTLPAVGDSTAAAARVRIAAFCEWFGVEPVRLKVRKDVLYLSDDLVEWSRTHGACLDWIFSGSLKWLAATYRDKHAVPPDVQTILRAFDKLDRVEQGIFIEGIEAGTDGRMPLEAALADTRKRIDAYRQSKPQVTV